MISLLYYEINTDIFSSNLDMRFPEYVNTIYLLFKNFMNIESVRYFNGLKLIVPEFV